MSKKFRFPMDVTPIPQLKFGLDEIVTHNISQAVSTKSPTIIHMLGIPGSGKSTAAKAMYQKTLEEKNQTYSFLAFDQLMESIPDYKLEADLVKAFSKYELPARDAGYTLLKELLDRKVSIFFDHSGAFPEHLDILKYCKNELGYTVIMIHVDCETTIAKKRIQERGEKIGRHTPLHYVDDRKAIIEQLAPEYEQIADKFVIIEGEHINAKRAWA